MPSPIKIAVIGAGKIGEQRIEALQRSEFFELVAFSEINSEARAKISEKYGVPGRADLAELPENTQAVVISTPTKTHHEIGLDAIGRGFHTIIEKPLASTAEQAGELIRAAKTMGVQLNGGFNYPYRASFRCLAAARKWAGPIHQVDVHSGHGQFMPPVAENDRERIAGFIGEGAEGPLFDLSIHHIQFGLSLLDVPSLPLIHSSGFRPGVLENASVDEAASALFGANGKQLAVSASFIEPQPFMALRLRAAAEKCTLEASFTPNALRIGFHKPDPSLRDRFQQLLSEADFVESIKRVSDREIVADFGFPDDSWLLHSDDFARKINGEPTSGQYSEPEEAEIAIRMIEEAVEAAKPV